MEKHAQDEKKRLGELKLSMQAYRIRWYFQRSQDHTRHYAQSAKRTMLNVLVRLCRLKYGLGNEVAEMTVRCVC